MDELTSLVVRSQDGDLEAFGLLVKQFQGVVVRYAYSILDDWDMADDAAQESFVQAYSSLPNLRQPSAFPAWLRAIVSHCSGRLLRGRRMSVVSLEAAEEVPSDAPTPAEIIERRELRERVIEAVRSLPEHEQVVTELFYFKDYSQNEIAELLRLPVTTVNNRLHSSRRRLKQAAELAETAAFRSEGHRPSRTSLEQKEVHMALTYTTTTRRLLKGDSLVTVRVMRKEDIPAMRRLDGEIAAGLELANAQVAPGAENNGGGPWADDEWLSEHFEMYESGGNITLLVENEDGKLVGFAELWAAHEPEPFGDSLDLECTDYLWEYYHLGIETLLLQEAEKVARAAGLPAVDVGTNTSSGHYPTYRRLGMNVFYEYDRVSVKCRPMPKGWEPSYRMLDPGDFDKTGLVRVSHWAPTDFDFAQEPGRPGIHEFSVDGHRVAADFWRLWEPGQNAPVDCELFAPPIALTSPELMGRILRELAFIAGEAGAEEIPLPCPSSIALDGSDVIVVKRDFAFAWMRKQLN